MSIATELTRIQSARNTIRTKLNALGLVEGTASIDTCASAVDGIVDNGAVSAQVQEGETYTIPKGYHNGSGTVSGVSGGGSYTLQSKTVSPTKSQQNVTPDSGYYGLSDVTVNAIPGQYQDVSSVTATAEDVLANKVFVTSSGVVTAGTMVNNGSVEKTLDTTTTTYTIPKGYHSGTGNISIAIEEKTATPTQEIQTVTPTTGKVLSKVTVQAIPDEYVSTEDANALASEILSDRSAYVQGEKVIGAMPNNDAINGTFDGMTTISFQIPAGYTTGGTVSLTNDIETALAAI